MTRKKAGSVGPIIAGCAISVAMIASPAVGLGAPVVELGPPVQSLPPPPTPFETGMRGFGMGVFAGLAGGYLFARQDGFTSNDWRPLVAGAGVGALAGGVLGFTLGVTDNNSMSSGRGFLVMRGMSDGGGFGAVAGGIIGGLAALKTDRPEHILLGAAIGTLAGTALGLIYGSLERSPWELRRRGPPPMAWNFGVAPCPTAQGGLAFGPLVSRRF